MIPRANCTDPLDCGSWNSCCHEDRVAATQFFMSSLPVREGVVVQTGTVRVHQDVADRIIGLDVADGVGCMVVAHVDLAGRLIVDEIVTAERSK